MKIFYYRTKEADGIITYYFLQLETIILKVRCLGYDIHCGKVSVMRPDIGCVSNLDFVENNEEGIVIELLEKVEPSGGPNILYLLDRVKNELKRLSKKVIIETKERLKTKGFTDEEIKKIEEYARRKLGHYSESWWKHKYEIGQNFKVYLFFYEDLPSFFYRELVDDGILWFKISRIDGGTIFVKCIDIKLD